MNHLQALQDLGLTEKESRIYLALLHLSQGTVQEIAQQAKVSRPNSYALLDGLVAKGLVSMSTVGGKVKYLCEKPENLLDLVRAKRRVLEEQEKSAEAVIEDLQKVLVHSKDETEEPFIRYFSGKRGLLAMRNDMLEVEGSTIKLAYSLDNMVDAYSDADRKEGHAARIKKNIYAKVLYNSQETTISNDGSREAKKVGPELPMPADIAIYNDKVRLSLFDGTSGVIIKNEKIAQTLSSLFDMAFSNQQDNKN